VEAPESPSPQDESLDDQLAAEAEEAIDHELQGEVETVDLSGAGVAFGDDSELPEEPEVKSKAEPAPAAAAADALGQEDAPSKGLPLIGWFTQVVELVMTAAYALSAPLQRLSPKARDTLGWIAINILFIGFCTWLVLLLR